MMAEGLLGYLSPDPLTERVEEARRRAPWRGAVSGQMLSRLGGLHGLGAARAGQYGHVAVALHGRLDNAAALAAELGIDPDDWAGIVAAAYLRHGDEVGATLLGDFALLVVDERRGTLLAVRDWIGARPLFWGRGNGIVAFGSEVKQVLALLDRPFQPNAEALAAYRRSARPALTDTFAEGVRAVAPSGQVLAAEGGALRAWTRMVRFEPIDLDRRDAAVAVRTQLEIAVARRTAGARRLGALISGGMDSTSAAATAAALAARQAGPPVALTLTMAYPDVPVCDETAYARQVAERWEMPWAPVEIRAADVFKGLEEWFALHDGPGFPGANAYAETMAAARAAGVDVLLTGQAADRWVDQLHHELELSVLRGDWRGAARWGWRHARGDRWRGPLRAGKRLAWALTRRARGARAEAFFERGPSDYFLRAALETEEREGMRQGIRVEFPFADRELAALLSGLPPGVRSEPGLRKLVLRDAMAGLLPEEVRRRRDKTNFDPLMRAALGDATGEGTVLEQIARRYAAIWEDLINGPKTH